MNNTLPVVSTLAGCRHLWLFCPLGIAELLVWRRNERRDSWGMYDTQSVKDSSISNILGLVIKVILDLLTEMVHWPAASHQVLEIKWIHVIWRDHIISYIPLLLQLHHTRFFDLNLMGVPYCVTPYHGNQVFKFPLSFSQQHPGISYCLHILSSQP